MTENRRLWKDRTEQLLPGHAGGSNVVYDEADTNHCYDAASPWEYRRIPAPTGYPHSPRLSFPLTNDALPTASQPAREIFAWDEPAT